MKNNLEYRGMLRLCLIFLFSFFPPPYFAHFPHGHCFKVSTIPITQQQQISGTVTDSYGPMPGVHVLIKGTQTGTFTDQEGEYSIVVDNTDTLVFSYLGYHPRELPVLGRTTLDIEMQSEVTELQEVEINAGYYTVKERERTGSISRVTAKEIELQPIVSPLEALQGRMAGVEVVQRSGIPGTAPTIRVRGENSLRYEGNFPLYIIDGVPVSSSPINSYGGLTDLTGIDPLSTLNLSNIESIEVLKDADATAIYGSRGANGVILVTTKKGSTNEKTEIEARLYSGLGHISKKMELLNSRQYSSIRKEAFKNDGVEPTALNAYDLLIWDQDRYTDWQEELIGGTATITNVNVSALGGNANTSFRLGGSYHKEGVVFPGDFGYHKVTSNANIDHTSDNKKLKISLLLNYGVDDNNLFNGSNLVNNALGLAPNAPKLYNEDGSLNWENDTWTNPLGVLYNTSNAHANTIVSNLVLSYGIFKNLVAKANLGYTHLSNEETIKMPKTGYSPTYYQAVSNRSIHSQTKRRSTIIEPQLVYTNEFGKGNLDALLGLTFQQSKISTLVMQGTGYVSESLIGNLNAAETVSVSANENTDYKYNAIFARLGYNWDQKYFLNLTGRRDGSSRFGPDKRFANFWAVGGAWIFSEELPIEKYLPFLSFGKLRGSYGTTGSDQIGDYGYLDAYVATNGPSGLYPTQLSSPDYSWEVNKKLEVALELGFLEDRIHLGTSWYRNRSSNQLVGYPLPAITGFTSIQANLPAIVQNTGWELQLTTLNIASKNIRWQTFLNFTAPRNKLVDFPNMDETSYKNKYRIGHPLNIDLLYNYKGIDPDTGFYEIEDVNNDGRFDKEDRKDIKNMGRIFYGGLNNNFSYKDFALQFLWEFVKQNSLDPSFSAPGTLNSNVPIEVFESWQQYGDGNKIQKISQSSGARRAYSRARSTGLFRNDASYARLKTVSLSYNLPMVPMKSIGIKSGRLFISGQNLFTITDFPGLDPQSPGNQLPALRTISYGVQFNF